MPLNTKQPQDFLFPFNFLNIKPLPNLIFHAKKMSTGAVRRSVIPSLGQPNENKLYFSHHFFQFWAFLSSSDLNKMNWKMLQSKPKQKNYYKLIKTIIYFCFGYYRLFLAQHSGNFFNLNIIVFCLTHFLLKKC